jgi:hypothetical protein
MPARRAVGASALGLAALLGVAIPSAARSEPPVCSAATAGQLSQQATVQCACRFFGESRLAGTPAGYRWDCGILQARMNHEVPVDLNVDPYPIVDGIYLDGTLPPHRR